MQSHLQLLNSQQQLSTVHIDVQAVKGLPELKIIGIQSYPAQILREKIKTAMKAQNIALKGVRKVVHFKNLPDNTLTYDNFELHITLLLLHSLKHIFLPPALKIYGFGKLNLDGTISPIMTNAVLQKILQLNQKELYLVPSSTTLVDPRLIKVNNLKEILQIDFQNFYHQLTQNKLNGPQIPQIASPQESQFLDTIDDMNLAKFTFLLSLLAKKSLLLTGSSGVGKTMLFKALNSLGTPKSRQVYIEPNISIAQFEKQITALEASHTDQAIYLIFNELADFKRTFLDHLKIFYDKIDFQNYLNQYVILASLNPCRCGNLNHAQKQCTCNHYQLKTYAQKIPQPLLDRFFIVTNLNQELANNEFPEISHQLFIEKYHALKSTDLQKFKLDKHAEHLFESFKTQHFLSPRRFYHIMNLARLLAAFSHETTVSVHSMNKALDLNNYFTPLKND